MALARPRTCDWPFKVRGEKGGKLWVVDECPPVGGNFDVLATNSAQCMGQDSVCDGDGT